LAASFSLSEVQYEHVPVLSSDHPIIGTERARQGGGVSLTAGSGLVVDGASVMVDAKLDASAKKRLSEGVCTCLLRFGSVCKEYSPGQVRTVS
jgi:hypothetical protein